MRGDPAVFTFKWYNDYFRLPWLLTPVFSGFPCGSAGKESACSAGDPSLIHGLGRSSGEGIGYPFQYSWTSLVAELVKEPARNVGGLGLIPGLGRSSEEGKGYPVQYSGLENSMDYIVHRVAKSRTWLSDFHFLNMYSESRNSKINNNEFLVALSKTSWLHGIISGLSIVFCCCVCLFLVSCWFELL